LTFFWYFGSLALPAAAEADGAALGSAFSMSSSQSMSSSSSSDSGTIAAAFALLALLLAFGLDAAAAVAALSCICCSSDLTDICVAAPVAAVVAASVLLSVCVLPASDPAMHLSKPCLSMALCTPQAIGTVSSRTRQADPQHSRTMAQAHCTGQTQGQRRSPN
jgi:hypothetical protein